MKNWHYAEVLTLSLGLLLVAQCIPVYPGACLVLATSTAVALLTRSVSISRWLMMLLAPTGFLITSLVIAPLSFRSGYGLWHSFFFDRVLLRRAELATLRSIASVSCTLLLLCSRSPVEWAAEMPSGTMWRFLADLLVLMERNFYLLRDSAKSIFMAQDVRLSRISRKSELLSFSLLCASLLSRAEQRARNLQDALDARLYNGELAVRRVRAPRNPFRMVSILTLIVVVIAAGCSR